MNPLTNFIALLARILLAILFVQGGYNKLFGGTAGTVAYMTSHGIPFPNILVWGTVVVELGIGLCLMAGARAGGRRALRAHHLLQSPFDHRRHARHRGVRRRLPQPRCLHAAAKLIAAVIARRSPPVTSGAGLGWPPPCTARSRFCSKAYC
jgi:DoxX-like protein